MVESLSVGIVVPYTPILSLHHDVVRWPRAKRLAKAEEWADDPAGLIGCYLESVERLSVYDNRSQHFLNLTRTGESKRHPLPKPPPAAIRGTDDLVSWIEEEGGFNLAPDRGVDYVEREVSVIRTTNHAEWDDHEARGSVGRALQPDLLLATRADRTPAIGEIKITKVGTKQTDKDPFAALVQALAAVAHLATEPQYERLLKHFSEARFRSREGSGPQLDLYLVTVAHDITITAIEEMTDAVKRLSEKLVNDRQMARTLRRIAFVELNVSRGRLRGEVHW
jgi:hypothetical protein